ncbi:hypothetical protein [uncultured Metabacillus sp.]|nr:hypothetical protein [uncultured Metabacillus sp.]
MTREEKVKLIIDTVWNIEGVKVDPKFFEHHSYEELDEEVDWYDYLLDK